MLLGAGRVMDRAIHFDNEAQLVTIEVGDIGTYRVLSSKPNLQFPGPQMSPQDSLGNARVFSQLARSTDGIHAR
jgi:hypothetical protein